MANKFKLPGKPLTKEPDMVMPAVRCEYTRLVPVGELKPNPKNPNPHSEEQVARIAKVIEKQGWRKPIRVSNRNNVMTCGHGARLAAILKGWTHVPVSFQDYDSEAMEYADMIADNALGHWDVMDMASINQDFTEFGPELDVELLGLKHFDIDPADKEGEGDPDAVPETPAEPKTKLGDLWTLGNHRLLCGDCTVKENVERLMSYKPLSEKHRKQMKADMVFTDPPYNHASGNDLVASPVSHAMQNLKDSEWDKNFDIGPALERISESASDNASFYICTSWHLAGEIWKFFSTRSSHYSYCVWRKTNPMPSLMKRHWTWSSELIVYATRGKHTFNFPREGHAPNVWDLQKNRVNDLHPTMKPVEVPEMAISHSSKSGDLVLDLFLGSGSTLIACEKTGRRCFGMEIDPHYCDVILTRFAKFSGIDPVRESDGAKWSEISSVVS